MSAGARSCPLLWRCYVEAELSFGRPQAARRVFLRAIHECPGSQVGRPSVKLAFKIVQLPLATHGYAGSCRAPHGRVSVDRAM